MFHIIKEVRDINRFNHILGVLAEEGFEYLVGKMGLGHHVPVSKKLKSRLKKTDTIKPEVRLRRTLEKLGPTFIKFGQLLSVRPDLIPKEYCRELEKLQDNVPPITYNVVREVIKKELGKEVGHIFHDFGKTPIASASISQVHKAALKGGTIVAVKIQRPDVRHLVETDIEIMEYFARILENDVEGLKRYRPLRIIKEFREWTEKEIDFRLEARNAKRFLENFKGSKTVSIPKIYDDFTTGRILTMEFVDGVELHNLKEIKRRKIDFPKVIKNGFDAIMTQVFVHGIFHADPHPGNIIVKQDNSISFVDFGIVGYFDDKLKNKCIDMLYGIVEQDEELIMETLVSMGLESETDFEQLKSDIGVIISPLQHSSLKEIKVSKVIEEILDIGLRHKVRIPASFVLFGKTIVTLEGVALEYDPDFKLVETTKPFIEKLMLKRTSPKYLLKNFVHEMHKYRRFAEDFPEKAEKALDKIQRGSFKVDIEDTDIKKLSLELDRSSNRVSYGMLVAALLVTSAILISVEKGPTILGIPMLAFFSFAFASFLMLVLFFSIVRERFRHW